MTKAEEALQSGRRLNVDGPTGLVPQREWARGWPIVSAGFIATFASSLPAYVTGLFMAPLQAAFGWTRSQISLSVTMLTLGLAVGAVAAGYIAARTSARLLVCLGMAALAAGFALLAMTEEEVTSFWAISLSMALFGAACSPVVISWLIVSRFDKHRGTALGLTMVGSGVASAVAPLLLVPVIATFGWRAGYWSIAVGLTVSIPIVFGLLLIGNTPARMAPPERRSAPRPLFAQQTFRALLGAFFLIAVAVGGLIVHFVPMLVDLRLGSTTIASLAALLGLSIIVGRLVTGLLLDRLAGPTVAAGIMMCGTLGFALLFLSGTRLLPFAAPVAALCLGAELDLIAYLTSRYYAGRDYGRAYGFQFFAFQFGLSFSPLIYAQFHDRTGSYAGALLASAVALAISAFLLAKLPRPALAGGTQ